MHKQTDINIKNKKASFDYAFIETYTAGLVLTGTEIKSIREGKASLVDTYCFFELDELWVKNMHIAHYLFGTFNNHDTKRDRKLLLTRKELVKLKRASMCPGYTIVPVRLFINTERTNPEMCVKVYIIQPTTRHWEPDTARMPGRHRAEGRDNVLGHPPINR